MRHGACVFEMLLFKGSEVLCRGTALVSKYREDRSLTFSCPEGEGSRCLEFLKLIKSEWCRSRGSIVTITFKFLLIVCIRLKRDLPTQSVFLI